MKFLPIWYDQDSIVKEDNTVIEANDEVEARDKAYARYNGNPPAPLLYLKKVG